MGRTFDLGQGEEELISRGRKDRGDGDGVRDGGEKKGQDLNRTQQIKNERNHYQSFAPHGTHIPYHTAPHQTIPHHTIRHHMTPYDTIRHDTDLQFESYQIENRTK